MTRWISLFLLLAIIAGTVFVLYKVMAAFLLPLFLAAVLTVIFRPVHSWLSMRIKGRPTIVALLSTAVILLTVLVPIGTIFAMGLREGIGAVGGNVIDRAETQLVRLRRKLGVEIPFNLFPNIHGAEPVSLHELDARVAALPDQLPPLTALQEDAILIDDVTIVAEGLESLQARLEVEIQLAQEDDVDDDDSLQMRRVKRVLQNHTPENVVRPLKEMVHTLKQTAAFAKDGRSALRQETYEDRLARLEASNETEIVEDEEESDADAAEDDAADDTDTDLDQDDETHEELGQLTETELLRRFGRIKVKYEAFRIDLGGGPLWAWVTKMANPGSSQIDSARANLQKYFRGWLPSVAGQATALIGSMLLGLAIMGLAVFYFLKDGPSMVQSIMKLSPLDDRYDRELLQEFDSMSRAVVLATLLSALAQGLLAAVAYFLGGFHSVFLLTSLTMVFAMVPFVGAAAIWLPACLWLGFVEERLFAAGVMFLYCFGVVSMADNLIKPYVLHGQSKLHPLLALLSVLGGVQALGPIGILVGPMVVSFLQALLNILHHELRHFERGEKAATAK